MMILARLCFVAYLVTLAAVVSGFNVAAAQTPANDALERQRAILTRNGLWTTNSFPGQLRTHLNGVPEIGPINLGRGTNSTIIPLQLPIADSYEDSAGTLYLFVYHGSDFTGAALSSWEIYQVDGLKFSTVHLTTRQVFDAEFVQKSVSQAIVKIGTLSADSTIKVEYWNLDHAGFHFAGYDEPHIIENNPSVLERDGCAFLPSPSSGLKIDSLLKGAKSTISTSFQVSEATSNLAARRDINKGCKRVGSSYLAWINTINAIDDGITYHIGQGGSLRPLFRSYPLVVTKHYLLFAQEQSTRKGVSRYLLVHVQ